MIAAAWLTRSEAATRYAACLTPDATHVTLASVLVSLLHLPLRAAWYGAACQAEQHHAGR
ncbi:MAG: hypothetical protein ACRDSF_03025 [Pseudonocardiaceae bacterium]